jgi:predicted dehydrogenase
MRHMRAVIAGLGAMGRRHARAVRSLGWEVSGCTDLAPEAYDRATSDIGSARFFPDLGEALAGCRPDLVIVATTAPSHTALASEALRAGTPFVLVEKPLAASVEEGEAFVRLAEKARSRVAVNHPMRFMPVYAEPMAWIRNPVQGGFASMTIVSGAGGWAMLGTHFVEAFRLAAGEGLSTLQAWLDPWPLPNPRGSEYEDVTGQVRGESASGKRFYLEMGGDQGHGVQIVLAARNGQARIDVLAGRYELVSRSEADRDAPTTRYGTPAVRDAHHVGASDPVTASAALLRALVEGGDVPTAEDGLETVRTVAAAYWSHESHEPVAVRADRPAREFAWA